MSSVPAIRSDLLVMPLSIVHLCIERQRPQKSSLNIFSRRRLPPVSLRSGVMCSDRVKERIPGLPRGAVAALDLPHLICQRFIFHFLPHPTRVVVTSQM